MDTAWIQVFVLTMSECIAPAGKTVCQEQELAYQFANEADCQAVMEALLHYKDESEQVIVDSSKAACLPTAKKLPVFASPADAKEQLGDAENWVAQPAPKPKADFTVTAHQARLAALQSCDSVNGVTPCKIGEIIIEGATVKETDVWQRQ